LKTENVGKKLVERKYRLVRAANGNVLKIFAYEISKDPKAVWV